MKYANLAPDKKVGTYAWNHQAHLGSGAFGKVYLGKDQNKNNEFVAVKVMEKKDINDPYLQEALQNELHILSSLKGPHVVGLIEHLETTSRHYIIQQFCNGGDFRSYLTKKKKLTEQEGRKIIVELLSGFKELVDLKLVHRDLKPENILIHNDSFKIADFGFGRSVDNYEKQMLTTQVGTPLYMSLQILTGKPYTSKSDVWSMGNIYYEMLFGNTPWPCRTQYELITNIQKMPIKFPYNCPVSDETKDFIKGCLALEEKNRLSWEQVFMHPINKGVGNIPKPMSMASNDLDEKSRKIISDFQEIVHKNNVDIHKVYKNFDKSKDNQLDLGEFTKMMLIIDEKLNTGEIQSIFKKFDINKDNSISFEEFQNIFIETDYRSQQGENNMLIEYRAKKLIKKLQDIIIENHLSVETIFQKFDVSGDKNLSLDEFSKILQVIDDRINKDEAVYIFKKFDKDQSGTITFAEFSNALGPMNTLKNQPSNDFKASVPMTPNVQKIIQEIRNIIKINGLDKELIFKNFDFDKTGSLELGEFLKMVKVINVRYTEGELIDVFKTFDIDKNGSISFAEFQKILN